MPTNWAKGLTVFPADKESIHNTDIRKNNNRFIIPMFIKAKPSNEHYLSDNKVTKRESKKRRNSKDINKLNFITTTRSPHSDDAKFS